MLIIDRVQDLPKGCLLWRNFRLVLTQRIQPSKKPHWWLRDRMRMSQSVLKCKNWEGKRTKTKQNENNLLFPKIYGLAPRESLCTPKETFYQGLSFIKWGVCSLSLAGHLFWESLERQKSCLDSNTRLCELSFLKTYTCWVLASLLLRRWLDPLHFTATRTAHTL